MSSADDKVKQLLAELEALQSSDMKNFDQTRSAYLSAMSMRLAKASRHDPQLIAKLNAEFDQYKTDFARQKDAALNINHRIKEAFPEYQEQAQALYQQCHFNKLKQLNFRLNQALASEQLLADLRGVIQDINRFDDVSNDQGDAVPTLEDRLHQQEQALLGESKAAANDGKGEQLELQSMKQYRALMKHFNVDQLIARAIDECPENPGPHNPQMLAVKALVRLRDLSPQYLRRFAAYIETLLWIEKNANKLSNAKKR